MQEKEELGTKRSLIVNDEVDLGYLLLVLWQQKWVVLLITLLFVAGSVFYAKSLPNLYKAEALLAPASSGMKSGGLSSQLGGLAALTGISVGSTSTDKTTMALAVLKSRTFLDQFVETHDLAKPIMFAEAWDREQQAWVYAPEKEPLSGDELNYSGQKLYKKFSGSILKAAQDNKSGLVRISVELMSPEESQRWLSLLIQDVNRALRTRDITNAEKRIEYLKEQLSKTDVAHMQQVFYQLIEQQLQTVMLAEVGEEYALKYIDIPVIPEEKSKPHRSLIVVTGSLLGLLVGMFLVLILAYRKSD